LTKRVGQELGLTADRVGLLQQCLGELSGGGEPLGGGAVGLRLGLGDIGAGLRFGVVDHLFGRPLGPLDDRLDPLRGGGGVERLRSGGSVGGSLHCAKKPTSDSPNSRTARSSCPGSTTSGGSRRIV